MYFFFFEQKTAYEMRISDWSSDVCSSDLLSRWSLARRIIVRHALWRQERGALCKHILRVGPPFVRPFGPYAECWLSLYLGRAFGVQQRSNFHISGDRNDARQTL